MPLYEFECEDCKTRFEKIQKFTDPNPDACPACGKSQIRKMPSSPAIQFKGSGFYITDYAKKSSSEASAGSKTAGSDKSGGDSSASSESKTESKAETKSTETKSTETKASTDSKS